MDEATDCSSDRAMGNHRQVNRDADEGADGQIHLATSQLDQLFGSKGLSRARVLPAKGY
jgi:hypothetical protein